MTPDRFAPLAPNDAGLLHRELAAMDPDRALSLAFLPDAARGAGLALARFFAEAENIPARVTEPMMGAIRVQWWREALDEAYGRGWCRAHPLVRALRATADPGDRPALEAALDAVPAFLEAGNLVGTESLIAARDPFAGGCADVLGARIGAERGQASVRRVAAIAAVARTLCRPPVAARSEAVETPAQRVARAAGDEDSLYASLRTAHDAVRADVPRDAIAAVLPAALTPAYLTGREPGPLRKRVAMTLATARGRL